MQFKKSSIFFFSRKKKLSALKTSDMIVMERKEIEWETYIRFSTKLSLYF